MRKILILIALMLIAIGANAGTRIYPGALLDEFDDVSVNSPSVSDMIYWDGTVWTRWTPAYGALELNAPKDSLAGGVAVYNGTIDSGTVANTTTIDGTYLTVSESGQFLIDFTFPMGTNTPAVVDIVGRYQGNPAHNVKAQAYNYTTSAFVNMTSATNDFMSNTVDANYRFDFPDLTNYVSGGNALVRIEHKSAAVGTHHMYVDYINVETASIEMADAGTFYLINGNTNGLSLNATLDADAGSITIGSTGDYLPGLSISFNARATENGTNYHFHVFVNGVERYRTGIARTISDSSDIGSGHGNGILHLNSGDVVTVKVSSEIDNAYISIKHYTFSLFKLLGSS